MCSPSTENTMARKRTKPKRQRRADAMSKALQRRKPDNMTVDEWQIANS